MVVSFGVENIKIKFAMFEFYYLTESTCISNTNKIVIESVK